MKSETERVVEFIDNGNAPEFFANGLHDIEVMGAVTRFIMYVERRARDGSIYHETAFTMIFPNEAIAPSIGLTLRKSGAADKASAPLQARAPVAVQ